MRIVEVEILFIDVQTPRCNEAFEISFSALQSDDLGRNALSLEVVRDRCRKQRLAVFVSSEDTGEQPKVKSSVHNIVECGYAGRVQIGCELLREGVWMYVYISVVAVELK